MNRTLILRESKKNIIRIDKDKKTSIEELLKELSKKIKEKGIK